MTSLVFLSFCSNFPPPFLPFCAIFLPNPTPFFTNSGFRFFSCARIFMCVLFVLFFSLFLPKKLDHAIRCCWLSNNSNNNSYFTCYMCNYFSSYKRFYLLLYCKRYDCCGVWLYPNWFILYVDDKFVCLFVHLKLWCCDKSHPRILYHMFSLSLSVLFVFMFLFFIQNWCPYLPGCHYQITEIKCWLKNTKKYVSLFFYLSKNHGFKKSFSKLKNDYVRFKKTFRRKANRDWRTQLSVFCINRGLLHSTTFWRKILLTRTLL